MKISWKNIVALNKVICEMTGEPHAVRQEFARLPDSFESLVKAIAERHPFVEGNKRTAVCLATIITLEKV